jgi:predicted DNA-binding protein
VDRRSRRPAASWPPKARPRAAVIPGYTPSVKTAISVPDETFAEVDRTAKCLGVTRSEFYARAARYYLEHLERESLTNEINAALELIGDDDDSAASAVEAGRRVLALTDNEW